LGANKTNVAAFITILTFGVTQADLCTLPAHHLNVAENHYQTITCRKQHRDISGEMTLCHL
jgi:hypothetical protein